MPLPNSPELPNSNAALRFACQCFDVGEKELEMSLERMRKTTPDPDKHFPKSISRTLLMRAESRNGPWLDVLTTLRRAALYDRIRRNQDMPLFGCTGAVTEKLVFSLLTLYEKLLPGIKINGIPRTEAMWVLAENFFVPTAFIELCQNWRRGLGPEFQGGASWYLPILSDGKRLKPVQRVLDSWLRTAGYRTAYGISEEMGTPNLRRNVDRWRAGQVVPTLGTLHGLVNRFAKQVSWLSNPDDWKARFTLACSMQKLCDSMDELFKDILPDSSLTLVDQFLRIEIQRIVADDNKILANQRTFFATRLVQLRLQREGIWETQVLARRPKHKKKEFPSKASDEDIAQERDDVFWRMNPGNWLLEYIKQQASRQSLATVENHLFKMGIAELNNLLILKGAGKEDSRRP